MSLLNKTTLKKMRKDALVEHILKIQKDNETTALFSSDEQEQQIEDLKEQVEQLQNEACDYESMRKHRDTLLEESEESFMKIHKLEEENEKLKEQLDGVKEAGDVLAQKFYDHYGGQGVGTLNWARQTGPSLGNMIDFTSKENKELEDENKELKEEVEEKDAHWNDWLNNEFGDELYPISPSPEPDEFVKKVKELKEENQKLTKLKNRALKHIMKLNKEIKELTEAVKKLNDLQKEQFEEEEEVEKEVQTCCECNRKKECLSDTFVTIRELDGSESVMCGMCSLNHFKSKSKPKIVNVPNVDSNVIVNPW